MAEIDQNENEEVGRQLFTRHPLLHAACAFAAGIVFGTYAWRPPLWWAAGLVVFLSSAVSFALSLGVGLSGEPGPAGERGRSIRCRYISTLACALAGFFCLGAFHVQAVAVARQAPPNLAPFSDGSESLITGYVTRETPIAVDVLGPRQRYSIDVQAEAIEHAGTGHTLPAGIRLSVYASSVAATQQETATAPAAGAAEAPDLDPLAPKAAAAGVPDLRYGQRLRFPAKLRLPHNFGNPGAFNYRAYLQGLGIFALASVRSDKIELLPGKSGSIIESWRSRLRRSLLERMRQLWSKDDAALMAAMVIGEHSQIASEIQTDFQRTSTYHILVVSGMNVAILAFAIFWLLEKLRAGDVLATAVTIAVTLVYAFVCESSSPILRATFMLAVYLATRLVYRQRSALNAIGLAALAVLALFPAAILEASFQMTFLAVLTIAGIAVPLLERTTEPYRQALRWLDEPGYDVLLQPKQAQFRLDLRLLRDRLARFVNGRIAQWLVQQGARATVAVCELLLISTLLQMALALPMSVYFHRATFLGLPANLVVVPLTGVLMPAAAAAIVLAYLSVLLAKLAAFPATLALHGIMATVTYLGGLRFAQTRVPDPAPVVALASASALLLAMLLARRRRAWAAAGLLALAISAAWLAWAPSRPHLQPGMLEITVIDVGQGDSILVVSPQGRTLLVDGGGTTGPTRSRFDVGEDVVSPYLWSRGLARLDAVALTHAHADHLGGLHSVLENFRPSELWVGVNPPVPGYRELLSQAAQQGLVVRKRMAGEEFEFGGARLRVLSPPPDWEVKSQPRNDDSLALLVTFGATSALLAGDVERKIERFIAQEQPRAILLKVAHHGSSTSTTPELLRAVQPSYAVISVGYQSPFGHPRREVLQRLAAARILTHRTDTEGGVSFLLDGNRVTPTPLNRQ